MADIKLVAKRAGVGIATVSRVINNSGYVKKETRERIEKAIDELGYQPNEIARNMINQKTRIVAFILPHSNHVFFSELLYLVEQNLARHKYKLMICNSGADANKEIELVNMLKKNLVDGLILLTSNAIERYLDPSLPIVSFDRHFDDLPYVAADNYAGGKIAATKLLEKNPKKLLYIGDDVQGDHSDIHTEVTKRRLGFTDHLDTIGFRNYSTIEYPLNDLFVPEDFLENAMEKHLDVDGIFTISDTVAQVVINKIESMGKRVPDDISVIGFDGVHYRLNIGRTISSIKQPIEALAERLVAGVLDRIHGLDVEDCILPVKFHHGDTH